MILESLMKFINDKNLQAVKVNIREEEKFGMCQAIHKDGGFPETFHYNKRTFSWY